LALGCNDRWDIGIDASGNFVFVDGLNQLRQVLRNRLLFIKNEWKYNISIGVPYYEYILIDNPNIKTIESIFKKVILETHEVSSILEFNLSLKNHLLNVKFKVKSTFGVMEGEI
jgi:hypothetical protein